jgi:hypothetical protein
MAPYSYEEERAESLELDSLSDSEFAARQLGSYGRVVGETRAEEAWLLTNQDVWVSNPHYEGPAVPHPESY